MDNLIFSLNATMPIFLLMVLGYIFRQLGWIDEGFASKMNKFVFLVPLPVKVFSDVAAVDISEIWDPGFLVFCFVATILAVLISILLAKVFIDPKEQGEFVQAAYRSSAALLGIAFVNNVYGNSSMTALMIIGAVPVYNVMAVIVLSLMKPESSSLNRDLLLKTLKGIVTNPIIIGIVLGLLWSILGIPLTGIASKTVSNLSCLATPMGLMAMGATFDFKKAFGKLKASLIAVFMKLFGFEMIFLPFAVMLGYRMEKLLSILVMLGSATTVASFVMAKSMGHEGTVTSSTVMLTTLFSAVSLTFWLWLCKSFGLI